jgi:hypothetical protein
MRQIMLAAAMAIGLIAIWAAILPLTAQPAPAATPTSPVLSKALFLCRGAHGIDKACTSALARALVLETSDAAVTQVNDRICRPQPGLFAER